MTPAADAMYDQFSPDGIVLSAGRDAAHGSSNAAHATAGGTPIFHHLCDFPPGMSVANAANVVAQFAHSSACRGGVGGGSAGNVRANGTAGCGAAGGGGVGGPTGPTFGVFRTILQPATYHYHVAEAASAAAANLVWVDPVTMGILAKIELESSDGGNLGTD